MKEAGHAASPAAVLSKGRLNQKLSQDSFSHGEIFEVCLS